jgi:hypothetical protein
LRLAAQDTISTSMCDWALEIRRRLSYAPLGPERLAGGDMSSGVADPSSATVASSPRVPSPLAVRPTGPAVTPT